ncbi:MAG: response regulator transcription factor [Pseudomonadota bacterium]|nr:response regulator transcription factor [Pseudomonadota bacterium]
MREQLKLRLQQVWPALDIVAEARDGREAVELVAQLQPDIVFLDIRMPALSGIEAAREISRLDGLACEIVFVTAYDQYAVEAFEHGALDYVLKPADSERLARTAARLQSRLGGSATEGDSGTGIASRLAQIEQVLATLGPPPTRHLRWLQATQGNVLRLIAVDEVLFFRSDEKYTRIQTALAEWLIRTPLRELAEQLDPEQFWQVHRSSIVNARAVERVERDDAGRLRIRLKGHPEVIEVSRSFSHLFRQT